MIEQLVERYVALWNEPDIDRRRREIVALWAPDGIHYAKAHTCQGYLALEQRVTGSYDRSIKPGVNVFCRAGAIDAHHNVARFAWHMKRRESGMIAATGMEIFVLSEDGHIQADYQFIEPDPK